MESESCKYCCEDGEWANDQNDACITVNSAEKLLEFDNSDGGRMYGRVHVNFCPWCGRRL